MENFYLELPENYHEVMFIDAKNKKTSLVLTLASFVLTVAAIAVCALFVDLKSLKAVAGDQNLLVPYLVLVLGLFSYIVLHELVHGAAYKALTHHKLTFGLTLTVAFCGVPDVYTSRKTALIAVSAPFVVFSVLFISLMAVFHSLNPVYYCVFGILFGIHFGGCVGDLYLILLLLAKYTQKDLLMRDTGPAQTFYLPD